ncbi:flavoprotein [Cryptosporidium ryanae]|uniref:flavoprotein n=1 Tax=Cryptosporidium ryanae TaxID=515981 RepID=UPI00351A08D4|nr:flavoprotein [Cryptosporidium ryanae]
MSKKVNLLVGVTGSVAAIKVEEFLDTISDKCRNNDILIELKVIVTKSSEHFFKSKSYEIIKEEDEYELWKRVGDDVLHIFLRRWADIFIIIPLTANTLAKLSYGLCDNLLTNVARAWDFNKPILVCPAMNSCMWNHPITERQIEALKSFGYLIINPVEKRLACGENGIGGLESIVNIVDHLISIMKSS